MDQQETFNWLVSEKARLEKELDDWKSRCFEIALKAARTNPAIVAKISREKLASMPGPEIMNLVLAE